MLGSDPASFPVEPPAWYRPPGGYPDRIATTSSRKRRITVALRHGDVSRPAGRTKDAG